MYINGRTAKPSSSVPFSNAEAQTLDSSNENDSIEQIVVDVSLLNGTEPFSIVEDDSLEEPDSVVNRFGISFTDFEVNLTKGYGSLTGHWKYKANTSTRRVNITMKLNYRKNWLSSWEEYDSVYFNYAGGLGKIEENSQSWYPKKAGQYRMCASGVITTVSGAPKMAACTGVVEHDGGTIIAKKDVNK
ncbi:hypothetical protein C7Y47_11470 [Lysinibacillus sphaericus]|uniref:Uncharacterized protein n=1 Tax=Lysinibacillus sphaericus TaxID=1421 RepID=A0A544UI97_LYSSH|nr:hypothetical protein [Lysinibacillus sp. SDF0037]TQR32743.1 hypothetical protein C7Y47_11470 [Lysinibacillus sp. SDF0037]